MDSAAVDAHARRPHDLDFVVARWSIAVLFAPLPASFLASYLETALPTFRYFLRHFHVAFLATLELRSGAVNRLLGLGVFGAPNAGNMGAACAS